MSRIIGVTANIPNGAYIISGSIIDDDSQIWYSQNYNYYRRGENSAIDPVRYFSLWPSSKMSGVDPSTQTSVTVVESWSNRFTDTVPVDGVNSQKFIIGQVKDSSGNPAASVTVKTFITSTDTVDGSAVSQSDGWYQSPAANAGIAHYVIAYLPGGTPTAGTTVNTLIPTNADGT